jgi:hypothetical protein
MGYKVWKGDSYIYNKGEKLYAKRAKKWGGEKS